MERITRKDLKHDEFVDQSFRLLRILEEHPRTLMLSIGAILLLVIAITGTWNLLGARAEKHGDLLSRVNAAMSAPLASDARPANPSSDFHPVYADEASRTAATLERADEAVSGGVDLALLLKAGTQLDANDAAAALESFDEAERELGDDPTFGVLIKEARARLLGVTGRYDEARAVWEALGAEDSGYPADLALLGRAQLDKDTGKVEEAMATLDEILELYPNTYAANQAQRMKDTL